MDSKCQQLFIPFFLFYFSIEFVRTCLVCSIEKMYFYHMFVIFLRLGPSFCKYCYCECDKCLVRALESTNEANHAEICVQNVYKLISIEIDKRFLCIGMCLTFVWMLFIFLFVFIATDVDIIIVDCMPRNIVFNEIFQKRDKKALNKHGCHLPNDSFVFDFPSFFLRNPNRMSEYAYKYKQKLNS